MKKTGILVYLAARFPTIAEARKIRDQLVEAGIEVTSRWLEEEPSGEAQLSGTDRAMLAFMDLYDVRRAHALVLYNPTDKLKVGGGGCHVETGMALAFGMPVFVLGERSNIFHYLPSAVVVDNIELLVATLHQTMLGHYSKQLSTFGHRPV